MRLNIDTNLEEFVDDNFKLDENGRKFSKMGRKHCRKRRKEWLVNTDPGLSTSFNKTTKLRYLTPSQTTNFRLFQTERDCRRQF